MSEEDERGVKTAGKNTTNLDGDEGERKGNERKRQHNVNIAEGGGGRRRKASREPPVEHYYTFN